MSSETKGKNKLRDKKIIKLLLAAGVVGAAGGVVRGVQLLCFDEHGFPTASGGIYNILWAVMAFELVLGICLWFLLKKKDMCGRKGQSSLAEYLLPKVAMIVFALAAAIRLAISYKPFSVWGIILSFVCFAIAASTPILIKSLSSAEVSESEKLIALLPVGAMVITLIELYRSVAKTPSASLYATDVFAISVLILLFFAVAGDINRKTGSLKIVAMAFVFVEIGTTAFLGRLIFVASRIIGGAGVSCILTHEFFEAIMALGGIALAFAAASAVGRRGEIRNTAEVCESAEKQE